MFGQVGPHPIDPGVGGIANDMVSFFNAMRNSS
jgi:hypothetical protein